MSFPPRLVSILVPVQWLFVLIGYAITRKLVKSTLGSELGWLYEQRIPAQVWLVSQIGWLFFLVPVVWGLHATLCADQEAGFAELQLRDVRVGLGLTFVVAAGAFWSILMTLVWMTAQAGPMRVID